jgi:hypothetical protein
MLAFPVSVFLLMCHPLFYGEFLAELSKVEEVEEEYMFHEEQVHVRPGYYSPKQVSYLPLVRWTRYLHL